MSPISLLTYLAGISIAMMVVAIGGRVIGKAVPRHTDGGNESESWLLVSLRVRRIALALLLCSLVLIQTTPFLGTILLITSTGCLLLVIAYFYARIGRMNNWNRWKFVRWLRTTPCTEARAGSYYQGRFTARAGWWRAL